MWSWCLQSWVCQQESGHRLKVGQHSHAPGSRWLEVQAMWRRFDCSLAAALSGRHTTAGCHSPSVQMLVLAVFACQRSSGPRQAWEVVALSA